MAITIVSHPTGVRGLKSPYDTSLIPASTSHPTGVRGLKSLSGLR